MCNIVCDDLYMCSGCDYWTSYVSSSTPIDGEADMEYITTIRDQLSSHPKTLCPNDKIVDIKCRERKTNKPSTEFLGETTHIEI